MRDIPRMTIFTFAGSGERQKKSPSTPEEGGFGSIHICASVPYHNTVYSTYPRTPRSLSANTTQVGSPWE